jgi:hypothetical protein
MRTLMLCVVLTGCVIDAGDSDELASTGQASTVLDNCAVGHAANALATVSVGGGDSYSRSSTTMDLSGTNRCDCINWQGVFDSHGGSNNEAAAEAAAEAAYPKCRPDAIVQFTVSGPPTMFSAHFEAFSELTEKVHTQVDCSHSNVHMELWRNIGGDVWQHMWSGTQTAHWEAGRCYQTVGEASPSVPNGLYRVKAVATPAGEQGYETIEITGT